MIYLNNASSTKIDKEVLHDFLWAAENYWANPSDIHSDGIKAKQILIHAQEQIAAYIGAKPHEIVFTSGGSESNNWAIKGYLDKHPQVKTIITTEIEHPSVYNTCQYLKTKGYHVEFTPIYSSGKVDIVRFEEVVEDPKISNPFVSIMMVNNEIGCINPIATISKAVHKNGGILHVDAVQAFGQIPINVEKMGIDMMSVSFHKFGGFKNCGFLYVKDGIELSPLVHGGNQFDGRRSGTENIPAIYALGNQVERMEKKSYPDRKIINYLFNKIYDTFISTFEFWYNGALSPEGSSPNILSLTFQGINAEALITLLDLKGVVVSAGSACCAGDKEPSRVLKAIGLTDEDAFNTIRISVGKDTTKEDCDEFIKILGECLECLKMVGGE